MAGLPLQARHNSQGICFLCKVRSSKAMRFKIESRSSGSGIHSVCFVESVRCAALRKNVARGLSIIKLQAQSLHCSCATGTALGVCAGAPRHLAGAAD